MFLVQEHADKPKELTLLISAGDGVIVGDFETDSFHQIKIPEPAISENLSKGQVEVIKKENRNITCIEFSKDNQYIGITTENKQLVVFDKTFQVVKNIVLPRVSSKVCFSPTNDILVADRTGDVYLYKITDSKDEPVLLLGHLSVILDMLITDCGNYIITCDRDEKIRVSHYPNAYNIASYCLGHTEFVTALKVLKCNILLSASGDGTVRMWNYLEGKQINIINTSQLVDGKIIEKFAGQMDTEKVDVTTLPITNIQTHEDESKILLAVSLYTVPNVYLYTIKPKTYQYEPLETINLDTTVFSYCLRSKLYIISNKLLVYEFVGKGTSIVDCKDFEEKLLQYKGVFLSENSDITLLYKRKYDNVQEYMERKKLRLEMK